MDFESAAAEWFRRVETYRAKSELACVRDAAVDDDTRFRRVLSATSFWITRTEPLYRRASALSRLEREYHGVAASAGVVLVLFFVAFATSAWELRLPVLTGFFLACVFLLAGVTAWHAVHWSYVRRTMRTIETERMRAAPHTPKKKREDDDDEEETPLAQQRDSDDDTDGDDAERRGG